MMHLAFNFTIAFSVSNYVKSTDADFESAFEKVQNLTISQLRQDGLKWLIDEMEVLSVKELASNSILLRKPIFEEFDSPNGTHASGYWNMDIFCDNFGFAMELKTRFNLKSKQ